MYKKLGITFLIIIILVLIYLLFRPNKIDILEIDNTKIDSIYIVNDSIIEKIDTVYLKIENNNKQYEKDLNTIISNDVSEDLQFFRDYINSNKARFDRIGDSI